MIRNIGFTDKLIRISIAITLIVFAMLLNIWWLLLVAVIPFLTAFIGFCPLYVPFKINTNKKISEKIKNEKNNPQAKSAKYNLKKKNSRKK